MSNSQGGKQQVCVRSTRWGSCGSLPEGFLDYKDRNDSTVTEQDCFAEADTFGTFSYEERFYHSGRNRWSSAQESARQFAIKMGDDVIYRCKVSMALMGDDVHRRQDGSAPRWPDSAGIVEPEQSEPKVNDSSLNEQGTQESQEVDGIDGKAPQPEAEDAEVEPQKDSDDITHSKGTKDCPPAPWLKAQSYQDPIADGRALGIKTAAASTDSTGKSTAASNPSCWDSGNTWNKQSYESYGYHRH